MLQLVRLIISTILLLALVGCTSVTVVPMDASYAPDLICLEKNPKVIVGGFEEAIRARIEHHGIKTEMYEKAEMPSHCQYTLEYTALKNWDIGLYLHHAELFLLYDGREIGRGVYHLRGKGGLSLAKWQDVTTKMNPVVDELLGREG